MSKEKQIKEMAEAIFQNCNCGLFFSEAEKIAKFVIEEQGYRKASEVAREVLDELERRLYAVRRRETSIIGYVYSVVDIDEIAYEVCELKKKYTEEGK